MSKFLQLCEQSHPAYDNLDIPALELSNTLASMGVKSKNKDQFILIDIDGTSYILELKSVESGADATEDAENINVGFGNYNVDKEVEGLAAKASSGMKGMLGKAWGTDAQLAKSALDKRKKVAVKAIGAYDQATKRLEDAINQQHNNTVNIRY